MFAHVKSLEKAPQVQFALGAVVGSVLRFAAHLLSGVFAFSAYAIDKGMNTWLYSLAYNSFVFADIAIAIVVGVLVFSSKAFMKQVRKFSMPAKTAHASEKNAVADPADEGSETVSEAAAAKDAAPANPSDK